MSTVITSGKFFSLVLATFVAGAVAQAKTTTKFFDFEKDKLGTVPKGLFSDMWGAANKGLYVYTSNIAGSEGSKQSLLLSTQPNLGDAGLKFDFLPPGHKRGIVNFEFDYMREEFGRIQFEMHGFDEPIWPMMWIEEQQFTIFQGTGWSCKRRMGNFKPGVWYRFKMMFPVSPEDAPVATISMTDLSTGEVFEDDWRPLNDRGCLPFFKNPEGGASLFFIKKASQTGSVHHEYLDNVKWSFTEK